MNGVNGWYSANQRSAGRHRVGGDEAAAEERQEHQRHRRGCSRPPRSWPTRPSATDSHVIASVIIASTPIAATHSPAGVRAGSRSASATPITTARPSIVWIVLPSTWPVSTDAAGDPHRAEPGDDAFGHVHRDRDRRPLGHAGHRDQDDPGRHVVRRRRRGRPTRRRGRRPSCRRRRRRTAAGRSPGCRRPAATPTGSAACAGGCAAASWPSPAARSECVLIGGLLLPGRSRPVRARKTSSRSGVWTVRRFDRGSRRRRAGRAASRSEPTPPSLGTCSVSASSSRLGAGKHAAAASSVSRVGELAAGCARRG